MNTGDDPAALFQIRTMSSDSVPWNLQVQFGKTVSPEHLRADRNVRGQWMRCVSQLVHTHVDQSSLACSTSLIVPETVLTWNVKLRVFVPLSYLEEASCCLLVLPGWCAVPLFFSSSPSLSLCCHSSFRFPLLFFCEKWPLLFPDLACSLHLSFYHCVSWLSGFATSLSLKLTPSLVLVVLGFFGGLNLGLSPSLAVFVPP